MRSRSRAWRSRYLYSIGQESGTRGTKVGDRDSCGIDVPICLAPAPIRACFAAEVPDGFGHWKGSPSAPRGARVLRLVGMANTESARVAARVATLSLNVMMGFFGR